MKQFVIILASALILYSCGDGGTSTKDPVTTPDATETPATEKTAPEAVTLTIAGDDQMKFDKDMLTVKAGQEVTLILTHPGTMSKEAMGHNWVLLKKGVDMQEFAMEAITAKDNDYIPAGTNAVIAHTDVIGGGEETKVTFTAPKKGTYTFLCTFPGHFATMNGKFVVE